MTAPPSAPHGRRTPSPRSGRTALLSLGACLGFAALFSTARAEGPAPPAPTPGLKIAVVDLQRAMLDTEDGLRAQAMLRKYFDRRQGELKAREEDLMRRKDDFEHQSKVLSKEALQRSMDDWQKQTAELQSLFMDYNREWQKRQSELTAPLYGRVAGLLRKIAKRDGYDFVLEKQAVPYSRAELDLTDTVILMFNAGEEGLAEPPAATGPGAPPVVPPPPSIDPSAKPKLK